VDPSYSGQLPFSYLRSDNFTYQRRQEEGPDSGEQRDGANGEHLLSSFVNENGEQLSLVSKNGATFFDFSEREWGAISVPITVGKSIP
jgi:hypothetical protein